MRKIFSLFVAALVCVSTFATTYTVAGSPEVLGTSWNVSSDANNDMTLVEGVYTLVKEDVTLSATTYEYKVVKDHDWNSGSWPDSNAKLVIAEDGVYDVTFTFVESTHAVSATATKQGEAVIEKHYLLVGEASIANGMSWDNSADVNLMTTADEGATYTLSIEGLTLVQGHNYEYKIVEKGTWTAYYDNGSGGNASFNVAETAVYTIKYVYTVANHTCEVQATKTGDAAPVETNYYLVGSQKGWAAAEANKFAATAVEGEYKITTTLAAGETLKVLGVQGSIQTWYPDGEGNEFSVTADYAGEKDIYFRPAGNTDWSAFGGYIYIEKNAEIIDPIVVKDLKLVPGVWTTDNAVLGCWTWGEEAEGAWSVFAGEGDTLTAKINENADSVIFVRFAAEAVPAWDDELIWNKTAKLEIDECGLFFVNAWDNYSWCEAYEPVLANGYYLIAEPWNIESLTADALFTANENVAGEYSLATTLAEGDSIKVVYVENDVIKAWYPEGKNVGIDAAHSGEKTIYFRTEANEEWKTFHESGYFWIDANEEVGPVLANGYYLIGNPWSIESLSNEVLFEANPGAEGEYMLNTTLTEGQAIKVVEVENDAIKTWYADGTNNNEYIVDANHAGEKTIYFCPAGKAEWGDEGTTARYIYIEKNASTGIDATVDGAKAVKVLRNGMLLIEKGGKTYNVLGTIVR